MNDLSLIEKFRADVPPPAPESLARARAAMFTVGAEPTRRSRWIWRLAPAAALAAAVAVAAGVVTQPESRPAAPAPRAEGPAGSSAPVLPSNASDAAGLLRLAAAEVRAEPVLRVGPGQVLFFESIEAQDNIENLETKPTWVPPQEINRKIWLPVDGSTAGLLIQTVTRTGEKFHVPLDADGTTPYLTGLPTESKAMRDWLYTVDAGTAAEDGPDAAAWDKLGETLREKYLTPDSRAALYEAAATIPGTILVKRADLAGRRGMAVSRLSGPVRFDYIFDARTYEFLGERVVVVGHLKPYPKGVVSRYTAQLRTAVVDKVGQLP
ncbi:CU044_5270 family protein [Actinoplanes sp. LDG1-06]|uniref:CU044_5270 family protein n=1 Tax=Paractinoplanes ovalisporus TaxID=2810368 RepID=A0ABS2ADE0_9ACTN|nr:CU044_5270 family protein [Actinoplanes ovalisporus]MBM2617847.1 CU044_5270 family protein [Actinoplanes ovalisporus]